MRVTFVEVEGSEAEVLAVIRQIYERREGAEPPITGEAPPPSDGGCKDVTVALSLDGQFDPEIFQRLTARERTILTFLVDGASNKSIATELNIQPATVKTHVKSLLRKLRVPDRTRAAAWGRAAGDWARAQELPHGVRLLTLVPDALGAIAAAE